MEIEIAKAIIGACKNSGIKVALKEDFKPPWTRERKTAGIVIMSGDVGQVLTAIISNPHFFIRDNLPRFDLKDSFLISSFQIYQVIY